MTFQTVVKTIARRNGLFADFTPKPLKDHPGNGFHINVSVNASDKEDHMDQIIAGILEKVSDMTVFFNPTENSYQRFGTNKAPLYISWSDENRSQLVRIRHCKNTAVWNSALLIRPQMLILHLL